MITEITMNGIKGINAKQELTGRDIIIGSNGAGKNTRTQALGISLLGYVPGGAKLPAETMKLASGESMEVGIETADIFGISRKFKRKDGQVTQTITITPKGDEKTVTQKEQRIERELGKLPLMLDFNEFLGLSDMKRREFIFALAGEDEEGLDTFEMLKDTIRQLIELAEDVDPQQEEILLADINECVSRNFDERVPYQEILSGMLGYAKNQLSFWKKERDKSEGASQKIAEYKNEEQQTDRNLNANKTKVEELSAEHLNATNELTRMKGENERRRQDNQKIASRRTTIAQAEASDATKNAAAINELIAQYRGEIKQVNNQTAIQECMAAVATQQNDVPGLEKKLEELLGQHSEVSAKVTSNETLINKLKNHQGTCPIDNRLACHQDFTELLLQLGEETQQLKRDLASLVESGSGTRADLKLVNEIIATTQAEITRLQQEEVATLRENEEILQVIRDLEADLKKPENDDTAMATWLASQREELQALLPEDGQPEWPIIPTTALEERIGKLEGEIRTLKADIETQTKARNNLANLRRSIVDSAEAGFHAEAWKHIAEAVGPKGLQGEMVKQIIEPLTQAVQAKLSQMDINVQFYFETQDTNGKEIFQFGWHKPSGERVNFDALSTGEQMLTLIALMTTIIERLNPPLKVLALDNVDALDKGNIKRVISGLTTAGQGMDNIILSGVIDVAQEDVLPIWKVWNLDGEAVS